MTGDPPPARLEVEADLRLDLDGQAVTVTGTGAHVEVTLEDPSQALEQAISALWPRRGRTSVLGLVRRLGRGAEVVHAAGLSIIVRGPRGRLLTLGGRPSRLAGLITGSRQIRIGGLRAVAPLVRRLLV